MFSYQCDIRMDRQTERKIVLGSVTQGNIQMDIGKEKEKKQTAAEAIK